jgi:hypothetical protein
MDKIKLTYLKPILMVLALWLFLTFINLNKAVHMDDTFHIEAAQEILKNPTKPMSGKVNWGSNPNYLHSFNQAPLFFYVIAYWGSLFGFNEISLHLLISIFTFLALFYFYKISHLLYPENSNYLLLLFGLSAPFIVNQNIHLDVPLLSLLLLFFYKILLFSQSKKGIHLFVAALVFSLSLLIKYSVIPFFTVMVAALFFSKKYKYAWILLVPIAFLTLWSYFNWIEYGSIHFLDRPKNEFTPYRIGGIFVIFTACIGALFPFGFIGLSNFFKPNINRLLAITFVTLFSLLCAGVLFDFIPEKISSVILYAIFIITGIIVIFSTIYIVYKNYNFFNIEIKLLSIALLSLSGFLVVFAPFMASRHLLLILPFVLWILKPFFQKAPKMILNLTLFISVFIGITLGISDWFYADYYRNAAHNISKQTNNPNLYSRGHWGWQWYSKKEGLKEYGKDSTILQVNDLIIGPVNVSKQDLHPSLILETIYKENPPSTLFTFFSGNDYASMYNASSKRTSWKLSKQPIDTIVIMRVKAIKPLTQLSQ